MKSRLVTLCTCQWADMDFEELCALAKKMGYDGLEIATWAMPPTPGSTTSRPLPWRISPRPSRSGPSPA